MNTRLFKRYFSQINTKANTLWLPGSLGLNFWIAYEEYHYKMDRRSRCTEYIIIYSKRIYKE